MTVYEKMLIELCILQSHGIKQALQDEESRDFALSQIADSTGIEFKELQKNINEVIKFAE